MSIYNNPEEYAKMTFTSLEQAEIRCEHFRKLREKMHQAKKCPRCHQYTLEIEGGSYEEGIRDYVYCENDQVPFLDEDGEECTTECEFTSEVKDEYIPISHWYDFDEVLAFTMDIEEHGMKETEKMIGTSWSEFVDNANKDLES